MSSGGMPELGSKISLISKADIRYEGRLFTVDPQECTIALANVKSFGTEDRETSYPIMPQPTVYDYILFRGSDIKDIRVVNNVAIPNDPAIMQMHMPQQGGFPNQGFPPMQHGGVPQMGNFGGPFGQMQAAMGGPNMPQQQQAAQSPIQPQHPDSRSGTPQNARKSPTSDMGIQTRENRENQSGGANKERNQRNNQRNNNQQQQQRERRDSGRNELQENKGGYRNQNQRPVNNNQQPQQQQQRGGYNNNNRNNQQGGQNQPQGGQQMRRNNQGGSARMGGGPPMNNYRQHNNQGTPNQNQNQNKPSNGPQQQQQARNTRPNHQLKFENEFDFEQANVKFEELRTQLQRLKVGVEEVKPDQVNGEIEKKDDSGNETGADQEVEHDDQAYDKNKSFFDNISCEAVERSKGKTPRTDWRQERKINSETFGYSFNRRGMNYRGQGRNNYQNRYPRQNYNRGPHQQNSNYRPVRNHRNQNNAGDRNNAPNPGQQSQNQAAPVAAN